MLVFCFKCSLFSSNRRPNLHSVLIASLFRDRYPYWAGHKMVVLGDWAFRLPSATFKTRSCEACPAMTSGNQQRKNPPITRFLTDRSNDYNLYLKYQTPQRE